MAIYRYRTLFADNAFDGEVLHDAPEDELPALVQSIGISNALHIRRIVMLLKNVRTRPLPPT